MSRAWSDRLRPQRDATGEFLQAQFKQIRQFQRRCVRSPWHHTDFRIRQQMRQLLRQVRGREMILRRRHNQRGRSQFAQIFSARMGRCALQNFMKTTGSIFDMWAK